MFRKGDTVVHPEHGAAVIEELREISRGIHPAILSDGGLGPALRTLARRSAIRRQREKHYWRQSVPLRARPCPSRCEYEKSGSCSIWNCRVPREASGRFGRPPN